MAADSVLNANFLRSVTTGPGVYQMLDASGVVLYVGKAKNLRARLASYRPGTGQKAPKTTLLLRQVRSIETITTNTEKEALLLEATLIKKYRPKFNITLRDDKNYPYLKVTVQEEWPRLAMSRRRGRDGARYFGPFASAGSMWQTLHLLHDHFPLRRCRQKVLRKRDRPCLNYQIKRCLAPCADKADRRQYLANVERILLVLEGRGQQVLEELQVKMNAAATALHFEEAARYRDQQRALKKTLEKQIVTTPRRHDSDVFALTRAATKVVIAWLHIKRGTIDGQRIYTFTEPIGDDTQVLTEFLLRFYDQAPVVPHEVLLSHQLEDQEAIADLLTDKAARKVVVTTPLRGVPVRLLKLASKNARQAAEKLLQERNAWADMGPHLARALSLAKPPKRIECLDISNLGGSQAVGSLVCFDSGEPALDRYRIFTIQSVRGSDDYAMMREVLRRRFAARRRAEWGLPDLLLLDGGRGQLGVASAVLADLDLDRQIACAAIAKGREADAPDRIFLPGRSNPLALKRNTPVLLFLMRIRDEAHRYGISRHRRKRRRETLTSALDHIPGVGPHRKQQLLRHFGSLRAIKRASLAEFRTLEGVGDKLATTLYSHLHDHRKTIS